MNQSRTLLKYIFTVFLIFSLLMVFSFAGTDLAFASQSNPTYAYPDQSTYLEFPLPNQDTPLCHYSGKVNYATLYTIAENACSIPSKTCRIYMVNSSRVDNTALDIYMGYLPDGISIDIITNHGTMTLTPAALRVLQSAADLNYISFRFQTHTEGIRYTASLVAHSSSGTLDVEFPEGSILFTVPLDSSLADAELSCSVGSRSASVVKNDDSTVTIHASQGGTFTIKKEAPDPYANPTPEHTLDVTNSAGGFVDLDASNVYSIGAESGYYLKDVVVNGVSLGAVSTVTFQKGDVIEVYFEPENASVQDKEEQDTAMKKQLRLISGVQNTTIKLSSSKASRGIKIKWNKSKGYKVDYYEVFRSVQKNVGYGAKPFYTTKSGNASSYTNTKSLSRGVRYYYKVRGVRVIDGVRYYTQWSNNAYRKA